MDMKFLRQEIYHREIEPVIQRIMAFGHFRDA